MSRIFYTFLYVMTLVGLFNSCNLEEIPDNSVPGGTGNASKFETSVGGNSNDFPNDAITSSDGGFVIVGYSQSFTAGDNQAYIVKLDSKGKQTWESNFGGAQDDYANAVTPTSDGGYVLCGRTRSFSTSQDIFLVKVNASGAKVWDKFYGATDSTETAFGIVPIGTNGDLLVGYLSDKGTGTSQIKFLRVNSNGTKVGNKLAFSGKFGLTDMIKTSDGKIVVVGSGYADNGTVTYLARFNEDGSFIWENRYPAQPTNYTPAFDVVELSDKTLVVAGSDLGSNDHDFNLVAYNQIGTKLWHKTWGGANADELFAITLSKDNQLVVMGYTSSFSGNNEFYLSKRKATDGNQIWERNFIPIANLWGALATASDGGFLLVGGENAANADILVVKTNENGEYK